MNNNPNIKLYSFTLDCKDPQELANFYAAMLGWEVVYADAEFAVAGAPGVQQGAYPGITFQRSSAYRPPVWPDAPEAQRQMAHLDFAVNDIEQAVQHALTCGATEAAEQFSEHWRVMFDPAGHPFCLCGMKELMESPHFALR